MDYHDKIYFMDINKTRQEEIIIKDFSAKNINDIKKIFPLIVTPFDNSPYFIPIIVNEESCIIIGLIISKSYFFSNPYDIISFELKGHNAKNIVSFFKLPSAEQDKNKIIRNMIYSIENIVILAEYKKLIKYTMYTENKCITNIPIIEENIKLYNTNIDEIINILQKNDIIIKKDIKIRNVYEYKLELQL
jgi:hypothetical protein